MANSKLSAYWKWRINSATEIEKFGLKFQFRKESKKNNWMIVVAEKESGLRIFQELLEMEINEDILPKITRKCLEITKLIYEEKTVLSQYFQNQYKLWKI